jgi:hypothetical protein
VSAVVSFLAERPSTILPRNTIQRAVPVATMNQPTAVVNMLPSRTGRRLIRSESAPKKGLLRKEKNANEEKRSEIVVGPAPNDCAKYGRTGITTP